jgi:LysR family transcriptional activator of nhaA
MEFLNYHHLRYFWVVAKEGGLTKAAATLHVSQPTISAQIHALEGVLGEKLFRRTGRNLLLTDVGQHVLNYAEEIFSIGQDLLSSMKQRPTSRPLRLHLGVADALPKLVTYQIIEPIFRLPQPVQLSCWETKVSDMLVDLAAYRLDVVLADEPASSGVNAKMFNHLLGECGVTFCAEAKLAKKLRRGFPKSLNGAPALLPMAGTGLRRSLDKWFHATGIRPRLVGEFVDPAFLHVLAFHGLGFIAVATPVAKEAATRFGFGVIGRTDNCRQRF